MVFKIKQNSNKILIEIVWTIVGAFIMAIGVSLFLLPNQLSSGGISGLATIVYYIFHIPVGIVIFCVNVPLFLLSMYKVGKEFFLKSVIGTVSFSFFVDLLDKFMPITQDRFLASVYGGVIIGLRYSYYIKG